VTFVSRKNKSKTKMAVPNSPGRAKQLELFGSPRLLEGEDADAYDELVARIFAAVKPVDIIDEIFIADVASLQWDVLRWRRLKLRLLRVRGLEALQTFLRSQLDYDQYSEQFAVVLAKILEENLPEDEADAAQTLAHKCARNEADAVDKVNKVLDGIEFTRRKSSCKTMCGASRTP
jgi:hypothetical protein